ncbi:MAG: hypothetical protein RI946_381, partial [Pseudomonadota bacterium]
DDGFVEYYQLLFDEHQIIYAEGIAAESMLFDQRTQTVVPHAHKSNFTQHRSSYSADLEVDERTLKTNGVSLLRDATRGHR